MRILQCLSQYRKWLLLAAVLAIVPSTFRGDNDNRAGMPPFDFTDTFYQINGIDPALIMNRVNGTNAPQPCDTPTTPSCSVVDTTNTDPDRRDIRVLSTTGGFDHEGNPLYYSIFGMVPGPSTFTNNAAGAKAMEIANFFSAYIFPKDAAHGGKPLDPGLPNRRQDNVFDTRNGYFVANPLGLWTAVFVSYTCAATGGVDPTTGVACPNNNPTAVCKSSLTDLAKKNGVDLDGTPQIHMAIEVDDLGKKGCAVQKTRDLGGSQGFPWII